MDRTESLIFSRLYQSYLTGGDTYSFNYKTDDVDKINAYQNAIKNLEVSGYITVLFQSDKKSRISLTDKGIDYANAHN